MAKPKLQNLEVANESAFADQTSHSSNIFDESFDLEEFMIGQSAFLGGLANFTGSSQRYVVNPGIPQGISATHNQSNVEECANQGFPEDENLLHSLPDSYDILQDFKMKSNSKNVNPSSNWSPKQKHSSADGDMQEMSPVKMMCHRRRDYSLSNDSGVEGCGTMETTGIISSSNNLPSIELTSKRHTLVDTESEGQIRIFGGYVPATFESSNASCNKETTSIDVNYSSVHGDRNLSNDSNVDLHSSNTSSRKNSVDAEVGGRFDGEIYGGGEMFSPEQYIHGEMGEMKNSSKKTAYNEKWGVKVLKAWCSEMNLSPHFEKQTAVELNEMLCRFWSEVRKSNGDYYGRNSLFNLRAMINKHLKGKPYCVAFDIVTDERFRTSNERLETQLKLLKGIGRTITHKQPISLADLRKMYDSQVLGTSNPLALLRKVWFEITLHFCHKGSEAQEKLKKTSFHVYRDVNGLRYVGRLMHAAGDSEEIRMYETGGDLCPVRSYELYLSKLHAQQPRLFQQPRRKSTPDSPMWYGKAPIGEKALQQMMANISNSAHLSKRYTNHCVRTTALEQFSSSRRKNSRAPSKAMSNTPSAASATSMQNSSNIDSHAKAASLHPYSNIPRHQSIKNENRNLLSSEGFLPSTSAELSASNTTDAFAVNQSYYAKTYPSQEGYPVEGTRATKRSFPEDFSVCPPPAYGTGQNTVSPPEKRPRVELSNSYGYEHPHQQSQQQHFSSNDGYQYQNLDAQKRYLNSFTELSNCGQENGNVMSYYKNFSDDSGTGRSIISPNSTATTPDDYQIFSLPSLSFEVDALQGIEQDIIPNPEIASKDLVPLSSCAFSQMPNNANSQAYDRRQYCHDMTSLGVASSNNKLTKF